MSKRLKSIGQINLKEYAITDAAGNPRYDVEIYISEGKFLRGRTATGSPSNYGNWDELDGVSFEYHLTRNGNVVFDRIKKLEV